MSSSWPRRIPWLFLLVLVLVSWGVLAQDGPSPPQTTQSAAQGSSLSFRDAIFVLLLVTIVFAGLIFYEWVRKRT